MVFDRQPGKGGHMDPTTRDRMGRSCVSHRDLPLCIERGAGAVTLVAIHSGAEAIYNIVADERGRAQRLAVASSAAPIE
jgi:hypothetical protein